MLSVLPNGMKIVTDTFNDCLVYLPLNLGQRWEIAFHIKLWMYLLTHVLILVNLYQCILLLYVNVISYSCHNSDAGLGNLC